MNLSDAHRQQVIQWIDQGLKISDVQSRLGTELDVHMTYMEVRFLIDDLKLAPKDPPPPKAPAPPAAETAPAPASQDPMTQAMGDEIDESGEPLLPEEPAMPGTGKVSLEVDRLARPGAIVSGSVTFSDGKNAMWYLDQFGRLGLTPKEEGYKPSQTDLMEFQRGLQAELAKMGF